MFLASLIISVSALFPQAHACAGGGQPVVLNDQVQLLGSSLIRQGVQEDYRTLIDSGNTNFSVSDSQGNETHSLNIESKDGLSVDIMITQFEPYTVTAYKGSLFRARGCNELKPVNINNLGF